jgi:hypothetical protein
MSEADVIARLYRQIKGLEEERDAVLFTYNQVDGECARLRGLLTQAADALAPLNEIYPQKKRSDLIAELRKAAQ